MSGTHRVGERPSRKRNAVAGALTAGAVLLAPVVTAIAVTGIANADDPPPCDQQSPDRQQQCQSQGNPAESVIDKVKDGVNQAQQQQQDVNNKPISQVGATYILNGAPICFHNWDVGIPGAVPVVPFQPC